MFYVYTLLYPFIIVVFLFWLWRPELKSIKSWVDSVLKTLPYLFVYTLILSILEHFSLVDSGWVIYSLVFALILVTIIIMGIKLIIHLLTKL